MAYKVTGPKGGTIIKAGKLARVRAVLPALVKRFGKVAVAPAPNAKAALTTSQRFVQVALSQLGTKENPAGSNRCKYTEWYGLVGPWCAIFVSYCCSVAGVKFRESYVPTVVAKARAKAGLSVVTDPRDGDLPCYDWPGESPGVADHIGIYASEALLLKLAPAALAAAKKAYGPLGPGDFWAIEGNTSVGNQSNGGEVMLRKRNRSDVQVFVRIT